METQQINANYYAVIMAGGIGSRFWPMSMAHSPKQFIDILGTGESLIQQTYRRLSAVVPKENIYISTNEIYRDLTHKQLPGVTDDQILYEPVMRNTAPAIAYACYKIQSQNPQARIIVAPSDHLITDEKAFDRNVTKLLDASGHYNALFTLGIVPTRPDTGYGYIQYFENKKIEENICQVKTFTEKPNLELAKAFIESGDFLWNSGMFVWSANSIISAFEKLMPEMHDIFSEGRKYYFTDQEKAYIDLRYPACEKESIDFGIMEKAPNVYVLPADFGWSDLGAWRSLYEHIPYDKNHNAVIGSGVMLYDSSNNIVKAASGRTLVIKGLNNYIVVEANNITLICPKDQEQSIKEIVDDFKKETDLKKAAR